MTARNEPRPMVLIVEDDEGTAELEKRALSRSGIAVCAVTNVDDAVAQLRAGSFSAILLDYNLPDGNPWAILEMAQSKVPRVPVIVVTAAGSERIASEAIHRGVDDYVRKVDNFWEHLPGVLARVHTLVSAEQANARLAAIVESSDDAIVSATLSGVVTSWNRSATRIFGYSEGDVLQKPISQLLTEGRWLAIAARVGQGESLSQETCERRKDGTRVEVSLSACPIRSGDGEVAGVSIIARDIGERRRAEAALKRSEQQLVEAQLIAHVGNWERDIRTGELSQSEEFHRIFGIRSGELQPGLEGFLERVHPEDRSRMRALIEQLLRQKRGFGAELRIVRPDGIVRTIYARVEVDLDAGGEAQRIYGTCQDVTEQRQAEEGQRRSESNFRNLVERSPDGIFVHRRGVILYVNRTLLGCLRYDDAEALLGRGIDSFVHPDDRELASSLIREVEGDKDVEAAEVRCVRRDGHVIVLEAVARMLLDFNGEQAGLVITRDVTERRQLQARIQLSDRMASVGTLAAGVAHEINNPLAYVMMNLEVIGRGVSKNADSLPPHYARELADAVNDAREGTERVGRIVRDLKTFSRAEDEELVPLDVHHVIDLSINMTFNEIRHRARLVKDFGDVPFVEADESRLAQVFINLLVNAAQAIPVGRRDKNEIRIRTRTDAAGQVAIEVSDTGPGIPKAILSRIFDPFFTTKPIGVGTGLGLAICHGIVTALHGSLFVESDNSGSTFRVVLPPAQPRATKSPAPAREPSREGEDRERGRVLVVEDEPSLARVFVSTLDDHDVVVSHDGRAALARFGAGERFDVILCDLMMPEVTGMELHAELSVLAPEQADRMIFVTGGAFTPTAREFLDRVLNPRLEKPFGMQVLRSAVSTMLKTSRALER